MQFFKNLEVQPNYFSKAPKWILWIGLLCFLGAYALQILLLDKDEIGSQPINDFINRFPTLITVRQLGEGAD